MGKTSSHGTHILREAVRRDHHSNLDFLCLVWFHESIPVGLTVLIKSLFKTSDFIRFQRNP